MNRQTMVTVGLALLVVLAGCSAGGGPTAGGGGDLAASQSSGGSVSGGDGGDGGRDAGVERSADSASGGDGASAGGLDTRIRIQTGEMVLRVDSYDATRAKLAALVRSHGGYVSDSGERTHEAGNRTWKTGHLVLRVPTDQFTAVFEAAKRRGTVESSTTSTIDVTDQLVDLEARLANLRAQRDRLRTLYERANGTQEVLAVGERLSRVQGDIERLEAKQRSLENRVEYATITVEIREERPERERHEPTQWYETGVVDAFLESVSGVGTVLRAMVVAAAYLAPYALVFGTPIAVVAGLMLYRARAD